VVENDTRIRGSCLCRAVAYAVAGRPGPMWHCHCVICRKLSGAAFATHMIARVSDFFWLRGQEFLTHYALSATLVRAFCRQCGAVVPYATDEGTRMVLPAGGLDNDPGGKTMCAQRCDYASTVAQHHGRSPPLCHCSAPPRCLPAASAAPA
jgi:hypothetical protein